MNAYSKDLRLKVLDPVERGVPSGREVLELLGISLSTISRYVGLKASGSEIAPKPSPGRKAKILHSLDHKKVLWRQLEENDTATLEEHCEMFEKERGVSVSVATMSRAVRKLGWTFKKGSLGASERDEKRRGAFRNYVRSVVAEKFAFVDECSTNISLSPIYARLREESGRTGKPRGTGARTSP